MFSLEGYVEERYVTFLKQKGKADQVVTNFKFPAQQVCALLKMNVMFPEVQPLIAVHFCSLLTLT